MFSGGVDSVVCLNELVKKGIVPKLFFFATYKVKKKHVKQIKRLAKLVSPDSELYVFYPHTIDFLAAWQRGERDKKTYYIHLDETDDKFFYPLCYVDEVVLGYVDKQPRGRRANGELGLAQPKLIRYCLNHKMSFVFPLVGKSTREVDNLFDSLPEQVKKLTLSTTRCYAFGGSYLAD